MTTEFKNQVIREADGKCAGDKKFFGGFITGAEYAYPIARVESAKEMISFLKQETEYADVCKAAARILEERYLSK